MLNHSLAHVVVAVARSAANVMIRIFVILIRKKLSVRCVAAVAKSKAADVLSVYTLDTN